MNRRRKMAMAALSRAALFLLVATTAAARAEDQGASHDLTEILTRMDELYRSESSYAEVEMQIVTPHWERTLQLKMWTKGLDQTLIRVLSPRKEKGLGTLRIGNEMWNYLPKTNKIMKVPPSMMMGSWMGSDFTNDDLVKEVTYVDDYEYEWADVDSLEPGILYIKCTPLKGVPVVWGHLVIALTANTYLPVWEKYYDEKNHLMRTLIFSGVRKFGERELPSTMEMITESKQGHKTVVRYTTAQFDISIAEGVFSLRNLRSPK